MTCFNFLSVAAALSLRSSSVDLATARDQQGDRRHTGRTNQRHVCRINANALVTSISSLRAFFSSSSTHCSHTIGRLSMQHEAHTRTSERSSSNLSIADCLPLSILLLNASVEIGKAGNEPRWSVSTT